MDSSRQQFKSYKPKPGMIAIRPNLSIQLCALAVWNAIILNAPESAF